MPVLNSSELGVVKWLVHQMVREDNLIMGKDNTLTKDNSEKPYDITIKYSNGSTYQYHSFVLIKHSELLEHLITSGEKTIELSEEYDYEPLFKWMYGADIILHPSNQKATYESFDFKNFIKLYKCCGYYQIKNREPITSVLFNAIRKHCHVMCGLLLNSAPQELLNKYYSEIRHILNQRVLGNYEKIKFKVKHNNLHRLSADELITLLHSIPYNSSHLFILDTWIHETGNNKNRSAIIPKLNDNYHNDLGKYYNIIIEPWKTQFLTEYRFYILEAPIMISKRAIQAMRKRKQTFKTTSSGTIKLLPCKLSDGSLKKYCRYEKAADMTNSRFINRR